jgi:molybdopterin-guanine dinucleotide biosynthesis protein A
MEPDNMKACIIAGGKSGRFGSDKSIYVYEGKPLINHVLDVIKPVFDDVTLIANDREKFSFLGLDVIPDIIPGLGPIGGIYTALEKIDASRVFIFPCDMPFLNTEFVRYMSHIPDVYDVIVPKAGEFFQPLHAIYSRNSLAKIKKQIDEEDYKMSTIFEGLNIRVVGEDEIGFYEDPFMMFKNINFKADLGLQEE